MTNSKPSAKGKWLLYRVDDNGNHFSMTSFSSKAPAESAKLMFERRGHKQAYFVTEIGSQKPEVESPEDSQVTGSGAR